MNYNSNFGIIEYNNKKIKLTPCENILFNCIYTKKQASFDDLCNCIYNNKLYVYTKNIVRVNITRINKKIEGIR